MRMAMVVTTAGLLLTTVASAQSVTYDYDKAADFTKLKTYAWVRGTPLQDELNSKRIIAAVDAQLALRGMVKVETVGGHPDVLVAYHASFDRDLQITGYSYGWGPYGLARNRTGAARVTEITNGSLIVDMVDAQSRSIIWRGTATKEVDVRADPSKRERNINQAVEKLFKHYPPAK